MFYSKSLIIAALVMGAVHAQGVSASATNFGAGCGATPLTLDTVVGVKPILGAAQFVDIKSIPFGLAFMAYGGSNTFVGGTPLPLNLSNYGMPGCFLYHDLLDFALPMVPVAFGQARYKFDLPYSSAFLGTHVFLQAWALQPGVNAAGMIGSNGMDLSLGNQ